MTNALMNDFTINASVVILKSELLKGVARAWLAQQGFRAF